MLNDFTVQGRLVKEPELRYTAANKATCSIRIACERDYAGKSGQREADFFTAVAWEQEAEFLHRHFFKGDMILLRGRMEMREWETKDGCKRYTPEIRIANAYFCGAKRQRDASFADPAETRQSFSDTEAMERGDSYRDIFPDDGERY